MDIAKTIALSAAGGLVMGLVGCAGGDKKGSDQPAADSSAAPADAPAAGQGAEKHCCKGKNKCKGKGGCAVPGAQSCKGQNECQGKGGCESGEC